MNLAVSSLRNADKKLNAVASNLNICLNSNSIYEICLFENLSIDTVKPVLGEIVLNSGLVADAQVFLYRGCQKLMDISSDLQKINTKEKKYINIKAFNEIVSKDYFFLKVEKKNNCKANLAICFYGLA